jgi:hypothetical protein
VSQKQPSIGLLRANIRVLQLMFMGTMPSSAHIA